MKLTEAVLHSVTPLWHLLTDPGQLIMAVTHVMITQPRPITHVDGIIEAVLYPIIPLWHLLTNPGQHIMAVTHVIITQPQPITHVDDITLQH